MFNKLGSARISLRQPDQPISSVRLSICPCRRCELSRSVCLERGHYRQFFYKSGSACISLTSPDLLSVCLSVFLGDVNYLGFVVQKGGTIANLLSSWDQPGLACISQISSSARQSGCLSDQIPHETARHWIHFLICNGVSCMQSSKSES